MLYCPRYGEYDFNSDDGPRGGLEFPVSHTILSKWRELAVDLTLSRRHARRLDFVINKKKQQNLENFPVERVRFQVVLPGHIIGTLAVILYGWTIEFKTSLAGPEVALFLIGFGGMVTRLSISLLSLH